MMMEFDVMKRLCDGGEAEILPKIRSTKRVSHNVYTLIVSTVHNDCRSETFKDKVA